MRSLDQIYWDCQCTGTCGCRSLEEALQMHPGLAAMRDEMLADKRRIEKQRISSEWATIPNYYCRACGAGARRHPEADNIWGCLKCGTTTYSLWVYFREVSNGD